MKVGRARPKCFPRFSLSWDKCVRYVTNYDTDARPDTLLDFIALGGERTVMRKHDGTDDALFPCSRCHDVRTRSAEKVPRNDIDWLNAPLHGINRATIWAIARVLGRLQAALLRLHLLAINADTSLSCDGTFAEAKRLKLVDNIDLEELESFWGYVVDPISNTVYYIDNDCIIGIRQVDKDVDSGLRESLLTRSLLSSSVFNDCLWNVSLDEWKVSSNSTIFPTIPFSREPVYPQPNQHSDVIAHVRSHLRQQSECAKLVLCATMCPPFICA